MLPSCALCGHRDAALTQPIREGESCPRCGSSWRTRATALLIMRGLGIEPRPMLELEPDHRRHGLGISDNPEMARFFYRCFNYSNSQLDVHPIVDLLNPQSSMQGLYDFVICSDVLEHVPPSAERAIASLASFLRPGGIAMVSVPVSGGETEEYYPDITDWSMLDGELHWTDASGASHIDNDPEIHGGDGLTIAFRTWGAEDFERAVLSNGFSSIERLVPCPELGVPEMPWSDQPVVIPPLMSGMWLARR
ncbi:MAG: methyltransferase domain-containing protein [Actinobacteria bacterium]|nr:methyltransferase domain-containing protein [Actinomycetota bacterium]